MRHTAPRNRIPRTSALLCVLVVFAVGVAYAHLKAVKTQPEDGAVVDRPVRAVRVFFNQEPDVALSEITLQGPEGHLEVQGLHTMGEKDLMARVVGRMPDGKYKATWKTAGDDGHVITGSWEFEKESAAGE